MAMSTSAVSDTAYWTAACRALESDRPGSLVHDHLAARLAGDRGERFIRDIPGAEYVAHAVGVRTKIIDDWLGSVMNSGKIDAVLNLGAGMDTRPQRIPRPTGIGWLEADLPEIVETKNAVLPKVCRFALDLNNTADRNRMLTAVAGEYKHVLVLTEGFLPYLSKEQAEDLAFSLSTRPEFHWWMTDLISPEHARRAEQVLGRAAGEPMQLFTPGMDFFRVWGWRVNFYQSLPDAAMRMDREMDFEELAQCQWTSTSGVVMLNNVLPA